MNKRTKLLDAMRNNPRDWRIDDLITVASKFEIGCRNHGGSHHVFIQCPGLAVRARELLVMMVANPRFELGTHGL